MAVSGGRPLAFSPVAYVVLPPTGDHSLDAARMPFLTSAVGALGARVSPTRSTGVPCIVAAAGALDPTGAEGALGAPAHVAVDRLLSLHGLRFLCRFPKWCALLSGIRLCLLWSIPLPSQM